MRDSEKRIRLLSLYLAVSLPFAGPANAALAIPLFFLSTPHVVCHKTDPAYFAEKAIVARLLDFDYRDHSFPPHRRPYISSALHHFRFERTQWQTFRAMLQRIEETFHLESGILVQTIKWHGLAATDEAGNLYTIDSTLMAYQLPEDVFEAVWGAAAEVFGLKTARDARIYVMTHERAHELFRRKEGRSRLADFRSNVWKEQPEAEKEFLRSVSARWGDPLMIDWMTETEQALWYTEEFLAQAIQGGPEKLDALMDQLAAPSRIRSEVLELMGTFNALIAPIPYHEWSRMRFPWTALSEVGTTMQRREWMSRRGHSDGPAGFGEEPDAHVLQTRRALVPTPEQAYKSGIEHYLGERVAGYRQTGRWNAAEGRDGLSALADLKAPLTVSPGGKLYFVVDNGPLLVLDQLLGPAIAYDIDIQWPTQGPVLWVVGDLGLADAAIPPVESRAYNRISAYSLSTYFADAEADRTVSYPALLGRVRTWGEAGRLLKKRHSLDAFIQSKTKRAMTALTQLFALRMDQRVSQRFQSALAAMQENLHTLHARMRSVKLQVSWFKRLELVGLADTGYDIFPEEILTCLAVFFQSIDRKHVVGYDVEAYLHGRRSGPVSVVPPLVVVTSLSDNHADLLEAARRKLRAIIATRRQQERSASLRFSRVQAEDGA